MDLKNKGPPMNPCILPAIAGYLNFSENWILLSSSQNHPTTSLFYKHYSAWHWFAI